MAVRHKLAGRLEAVVETDRVDKSVGQRLDDDRERWIPASVVQHAVARGLVLQLEVEEDLADAYALMFLLQTL